MYTVSFKDSRNYSVVVRIDDGSSTTKELTPASTPLITELTDSDDYFEPIRYTTGSINVIMNPKEATTLCMSSPLNRRVTININNGISWQGFLQCSAFTQSFSSDLEEVSLPIISAYGLLKSIKPSNDVSTFREIPLAKLFCDIDDIFTPASASSFYRYWYLPGVANSTGEGYKGLLTYFHLAAFAEWKDDEERYEMCSYFEIVENLMRALGWTLLDDGYDIRIINNRNNGRMADYAAYNKNRLLNYNNLYATVSTYRYESDIISGIRGSEHKLDVLQGKRSISVSTKEIGKTTSIFSFNVDDYGESITRESLPLGDKNVYDVMIYKGRNGFSIGNTKSVSPVDVQIEEKKGSTVYGGSILNMRHRDPTIDDIPGFTACVVLRYANRSDYSGTIPPLTIDTHGFLRIDANSNNGIEYLKLNISADCRESIYDDWQPYNGNLTFFIWVENDSSVHYWSSQAKVWSTQANSCTYTFKDGNLVSDKYEDAALCGQGAIIGRKTSAAVVGRIKISTSYSGVGSKPKFLRLKSISLVGCLEWIYDLATSTYQFVKKSDINQMYSEDYDVQLRLSDYDYVASADIYKLRRGGMVFFSENIFNVYKNYYSKCHSVLTIDRYAGIVRTPIRYCVFSDNVSRTCLYYSYDWKTNLSTAKFYEDN